MKALNPHIRFGGNAREAVGFYQTIFGGEAVIIPVGEREGPGLPADSVFHAEIKFGGFSLLAADDLSLTGDSTTGERISLHIECTDQGELEGFYRSLADGGTVHCSLGPAFGGLYAHVTDRFGVTWFLTLPD
jgi:PhnB protein